MSNSARVLLYFKDCFVNIVPGLTGQLDASTGPTADNNQRRRTRPRWAMRAISDLGMVTLLNGCLSDSAYEGADGLCTRGTQCMQEANMHMCKCLHTKSLM